MANVENRVKELDTAVANWMNKWAHTLTNKGMLIFLISIIIKRLWHSSPELSDKKINDVGEFCKQEIITQYQILQRVSQ